MPGSRRATSTLMLLCALSLLAHTAPARAQATNPDFSNVTDILHGRRTLFPVDDIVLSFNVGGSPTLTTILQTTGGSISGQTQYTAASPSPSAQPLLVAAARMFNLPRAVVVTLFAGSTNLHDQTSGLSQSFPNAVAPTLAPTTTYAVTDLAGNGYAAIVFIGNTPQAPTPNVPGGAIGTIMAANVNDPTQGFFYGTPMSLPPQTLVGFEFGGIAAGDFDGDGANEIAVSYLGPCPPPCFGNPIVVAIFKPNVTTDAQGNVTALTLVPAGSVTIQPGAITGTTLTAGKYLGSPSSQLALIYSGAPSTPTTVQPIAVSPTSDPTQVSFTLATPLVIDQHMYLFMSAQSGPLDYFENTDQLVVLLQRFEVDEGTLAVVTFDSQLNASVASSVTVPAAGAGLQLGIALGNFDQPDPARARSRSRSRWSSPRSVLRLSLTQLRARGADLSGRALQQLRPEREGSSRRSGRAAAPSVRIVGLATGDTQGRSLILGPPSKLTAKHTQPELILGAPPMHVDYVTPANSSGPIVLNLSAVPQGFNSSYKTTITNSTQSSRQATTSYTNAVNASTSVGFKFGTPLTGDVSAKVGVSAGFMHRKSIEKRYGQYASTQFDASTITGFDDQVWFSNKTHYIFIYPVIGRTACPADTPNCTDPGPMFVMFSGPTVNLLESVGGASLEWYQPIHETGNVFSYPWSLEQLQAAEGGIDLLTSSDPDGFATDSSTHTAEATWAGQQTTTSTSGTASNISWKVSTSVTESAGIFGGAVGSQNFSYNGSVAISTLNTLTTKVGESTGIGIVKPGTFPSPPLYQYPVFPYVFGDNPVPGTLQNLNLGTQLQTSGILRAAYTADPTNPSAGSWWQGAYTSPDVAVNHPTRWSTQLITPTAPQPNCIPVAATSRNQACVTFNPPESDIWTSEFHYMKGLLDHAGRRERRGAAADPGHRGRADPVADPRVQLQPREHAERQQHRRPVLRAAVGPDAARARGKRVPDRLRAAPAAAGLQLRELRRHDAQLDDRQHREARHDVLRRPVPRVLGARLHDECPGARPRDARPRAHGDSSDPRQHRRCHRLSRALQQQYRVLPEPVLHRAASERCLIQPRAGRARHAAGRGIGVPGLPGRQGDHQRAGPLRERRRRALRPLP